MGSPAHAPARTEASDLSSLHGQTDPQVVRRVLLESLDEVRDICRNRVRTSADGETTWGEPDVGNMLKAIELAAKITGAIGVDPDSLLRFKAATEEMVRQASKALRERESRVVQVISAKATEKPKSEP